VVDGGELELKDKAHIRYFDVGPYPVWFGFTTNENKFQKELKRLGIKEDVDFVSCGKDATAHFFEQQGKLNVIVTISGLKKRKKEEVIGLLIHEAVHVWHEICDYIGERDPGVEISCYSIQNIAQSMIGEIN